MIEIEVLGAERVRGLPSSERIQQLCDRAAACRGVEAGHLAIAFVDEAAISELNERHRGRRGPTDVLSFPIDEAAPLAGDGSGGMPRELGDVVICPERTVSLEEAIVHGVLHLLGMDHESDDGEMLALQDELLGAGER
jgi:probable rRNA maturation factor